MKNVQFEVADFHDIDHLLTLGIGNAEIIEMFSHYGKEEIEKLIYIVVAFREEE